MQRYLYSAKKALIPLVVFVAFTLYLTYNSLSVPSIVIGDNFFWSQSTIDDLLKPSILHESYLGDVSILSILKGGFLYPLAALLTSANLPSTLIYPFLFYLLSMVSFFLLTGEFLKNRSLRIIVALLYVINPVIPYYYSSMLLAFAVVLLPLSLKYFIRTLREIEHKSMPRISLNFLLSGLFLGLSISAHEQLLPSVLLISLFFLVAFLVFSFQQGKFSKMPITFSSFVNAVVFLSVILLITIPLILSMQTAGQSQLSSYYTGRLNDFIDNVEYTYQNVRPDTLLRFGGDSGVGLGQNAWFDSSVLTNIFGYVLIVLVAYSAILIVRRRNDRSADKTFFSMTLIFFLVCLFLIAFVRYLPTNRILLDNLFSLPFQSWESPTKLRLMMYLSALVTSLFVFQRLEAFGRSSKTRAFGASLIILAVCASTVVYNSPWLLDASGMAPFQQISNELGWGNLAEKKMFDIAKKIDDTYLDRGIIVPYTHKAELYSPPNFRLLQLVSEVNNRLMLFSEGLSVSWSKVFGLLSAEHIVINNAKYDEQDILIFPKPFDRNLTRLNQEVASDPDLTLAENFEDLIVYKNRNSLPLLYASDYFVLYDDVGTLRYALQSINMTDLPVFVGSDNSTVNQFIVPPSGSGLYEVNVLLISNNTDRSSLDLRKTSDNVSTELVLYDNPKFDRLQTFSANTVLSPGDILELPTSDNWVQREQIENLTLASENYPLGTYGSFRISFKVNVLQAGEYSFLSPRVLINAGGTTYFLIFHDNGHLELSVMDQSTFYSGILTANLAYNLKDSNNSIDVTVCRVFDGVEVYVNGDLSMSFPIIPELSSVSITSENSISSFTNVRVETRDIFRFFATKIAPNTVSFSVNQQSAEQSSLTLYNADSDFAIVDQHLNLPLRNLQPAINTTPIAANVLFNGWIVHRGNTQDAELVYNIGVRGSEWILAVTYFSTAVTYLLFVVGFSARARKVLINIGASIFRRTLRYKVKKGE